MAFYKIKDDTTGELLIVNFAETNLVQPTITEFPNPDYKYNFSNVSDIIANVNPNFDNTITMFINSSSDLLESALKKLGFTSIVNVYKLTDHKLIFSSNYYIIFSKKLNVITCEFYDPNDKLLGKSQGSAPSSSKAFSGHYWNLCPPSSSVAKTIYDITYEEMDYAMWGVLVDNFANDKADYQYSGFNAGSGAKYTACRYISVSETDYSWLNEFWSSTKPDMGKDPYERDGTSGDDNTGGQGGTGNLDGTSDNIDIPDLPTLSAVDTGFVTLFNPSGGQLKALANYMWSNDLFDLDTYKKIFNNPMDCIMGLAIVPVSVPSSGSAGVTVGNILTSISMPKVSTQYVEVDCGTLNVNEYWGAYLDYDPYTKAEIYLPYCGTHALKTDDIMNKTVHVVYHVDILSGACCAYVKCGNSVLYSFIGQCSSSIPVSGSDMTNVINGVLGIAGAVGSMVATGGLSAPVSAGTAVGAITSTASNVMNMKPNVEKSGAMGGTGGMLGVQTPYIILTRPKQCLPANQNSFEGYPSYITRTVSSLSGYTTFEEIHLDGMSCTDAEKTEIENILKTGVIL